MTVGSWNAVAMASSPKLPGGKRNYWSDACLVEAGGHASGVLDFYEVHSYAQPNQPFDAFSPFVHGAGDYEFDRPLLVGEFASDGGVKAAGKTDAELYKHAHGHGFAGAWGWCAIGGGGVDDMAELEGGLRALASEPDVPIAIAAHSTPVRDSCDCSDKNPGGGYTCAQQASWGKCGASFMKGFCCKSCHACVGCS